MPLCFVIGPIGGDGSPERKNADLLLHEIIRSALQGTDFGYEVKRADEDPRPGMIAARLINDIIDADLVVADLTAANPNAFYELAVRHATRRPAIHMTCDPSTRPLPFDVAGHDTIFVDLMDWKSKEAAREKLKQSARAIKENTYEVTNPIIQANANIQLRRSTDPHDQTLATVLDRLDSLDTRLHGLIGTVTSSNRYISAGLHSIVNQALNSRLGPPGIGFAGPSTVEPLLFTDPPWISHTESGSRRE
jgi:hypothetical protein